MKSLIKKWDFLKHKYSTIVYDDTKNNYKSYGNDMDEIVECPNCHKKLRLGECYVSYQYQVPIVGFGFAVCGKCYEKEIELRRINNDYKRINKRNQK